MDRLICGLIGCILDDMKLLSISRTAKSGGRCSGDEGGGVGSVCCYPAC